MKAQQAIAVVKEIMAIAPRLVKGHGREAAIRPNKHRRPGRPIHPNEFDIAIDHAISIE